MGRARQRGGGGRGQNGRRLELTLCSSSGHIWHVAPAAAHCPHLALDRGLGQGNMPCTNGRGALAVGAVVFLAPEGQHSTDLFI